MINATTHTPMPKTTDLSAILLLLLLIFVFCVCVLLLLLFLIIFFVYVYIYIYVYVYMYPSCGWHTPQGNRVRPGPRRAGGPSWDLGRHFGPTYRCERSVFLLDPRRFGENTLCRRLWVRVIWPNTPRSSCQLFQANYQQAN